MNGFTGGVFNGLIKPKVKVEDSKDITEIWKLYQIGEDHHNKASLYTKTDKAHKFFEGDQWDGLQSGGEVLSMFNFIQPTCEFKIAMVALKSMRIEYTNLEYAEILSEMANTLWEISVMDKRMWEMVKEACITGDAWIYFYDKLYHSQLIDNINIYLADEQQRDIQQQRYVLIYERRPVADVREDARANGVSDDEIELIMPDDETHNQAGDAANEVKNQEDGKCSCLLYMRKDEKGDVCFTRATKHVVYQPEQAVDGMKYFPVASYVWLPRKGSARGRGEVEGMIPNQIECNRLLARRALSAKVSAFPRPVYSTALAGISKKVFVFRVDEARFAVYTFEDREYDKIREKIDVRFRSGWEVPEKHLELKLTVCCIPHLPCKNAAERFPSIISAAFRQAESSGIRGNMFTADDAFLSGLYRNVAVDFALNRALRDGEGIEFGLQPIYSVKERRFTGAEALLRFYHADLGIVSPTELITIAERNGMILELDRTMVGLTADFIRANDPAKNLGIQRIGINLSAVDFISAEIPQRLSDILLEKGIDPNAVIFEITETASTTSPEVLRSCMKRFKEQGYRFALDDFGTGFANLIQFIDFPYDVVKLDQRMLTGSPIVFEHLVSMLSQMGVSLLVEGIETEEQAMMIENIPGISFAQGYYYARPMPPALFVDFIRIKNNLPQE